MRPIRRSIEPQGRGNQGRRTDTGLTGANASYGRSTREGVELAVEEINASGILPEGFETVFEDDQMTPSVGVSAFQRLQTSIKPAVVIGPFGSSVVLAVAPIANRTETVIISASATANSIADAGDFVFRPVCNFFL